MELSPKVRRIAILALLAFGALNLATGSPWLAVLCVVWAALLLLQAWVHAHKGD